MSVARRNCAHGESGEGGVTTAGVRAERRIATSRGPFVVRAHARGATVGLLVATPFSRRWFAAALDVARPSLRTHEYDDGHRFPFDARRNWCWSMMAPSPGNGLPLDPFARATDFVGYACADLASTEPRATLSRIRSEADDLIRQAAREALWRCDPEALRLARRVHPETRFYVYALLLRDHSGRVRQLVETCPGLLLFCAATGKFRDGAQAVHDVVTRVAAGERLSRIIRGALEATVAERSVWDPELADDLAAVGRDEYVKRACRLVRRAGPAVHPAALTAAAPLAFAPEDIPRRHDRNAQWYMVMLLVARGLIGFPRDVAVATSSFASRHYRAVAGAGRRIAANETPDPLAPHWGIEAVTKKLAVHGMETGRRPRRASAPARYIARVCRWHQRERGGGSAAHRVGVLLDRLRELDLGELAGVKFLCDDLDWSDAERPLVFPEWPWSAVTVPGMTVEHIGSAAELADEGREMSHCAATTLADAIAGELMLFSVRMPGSRLTLALAPRHDGTYEISEVRGFGDRDPSARESERLSEWVAAVNRAASQ